MKKTLLLSTVMFSSSLLFGANIYDAMEKFNSGEQHLKTEHLALKKEFAGEELDLKAKHLRECADLKSDGIARLRTEGFSEQLLKDKLAKKLALCERHMEECKRLCDDHYARGEALFRKAKDKLQSFKDVIGGVSSYFGRQAEQAKTESGGFLKDMLDRLTHATGA